MTMLSLDLEIHRHRLSGIAEEMGAVLARSAFSPNIRERRDFSCALFDGKGRLAAQAAHIPVHLGSMDRAVAAARNVLGPGDTVILNDPFRGGTHLPDVTVVQGVFAGRRALGFAAVRAHHADIGGARPGSFAITGDILGEGLRLPPMVLWRKGRARADLLEWILANVRAPAERQGDLEAQRAAAGRGARAWARWHRGMGHGPASEALRRLHGYAERRMRHAIAELPRGRFEYEDCLDDDGRGCGPLPIRAAVRLLPGGAAEVDFTGTHPEVEGNVNAVLPVAEAAVRYAFLCLAGGDIPVNAGAFRPIRVVAPLGTIVNARPPRGVVGGNVETSQRIVDVVLGALAQAAPDRIPAASAGTMTNLALGAGDRTFYETVPGGMGARPDRPGLDAIQTHMTNTRITPVEVLETSFPVRVIRSEVLTGTGGPGRRRGGNGLVREIEALVPTEVTLLADRHDHRPYGLAGGSPGRSGRAEVRSTTGRRRRVPSKTTLRLAPGERLILYTPGGGGWGPPHLTAGG